MKLKSQLFLILFLLICGIQTNAFADEQSVTYTCDGYAITLPSKKWKKNWECPDAWYMNIKTVEMPSFFTVTTRYFSSQIYVERLTKFNSGNAQNDWHTLYQQREKELPATSKITEKNEQISNKSCFSYVVVTCNDAGENIFNKIIYFIPGGATSKNSLLLHCTCSDAKEFAKLRTTFDAIASSLKAG